MRIIHSQGFPEDERHQTRAVIYSNIVVAFKVLLDIMKAEGISYEHDRTRVRPSLIQIDLTVFILFSFKLTWVTI